MATWKDGPRYAPRARPYGFAAPATSVSLAPPAPTPPIPAAPPMVPAFVQSHPVAPLGALAARPVETRNPATPFATQSMMLTAKDPTQAIVTTGQPQTSARSGVAAVRSPNQPFKVASSAASTKPNWAPPSEFDHPAAVVHPVAVRDALNAAYPPLLIGLGVMGLVQVPILGMITLASVPFLFAQRTRFRVRQVKITSIVLLGVLAVLWLIQAFLNTSTINTDIGMGLWCMLACWSMALIDIFLQWMAIRNGEAPSS